MSAVEPAARSYQCAAIGLRNPHITELMQTRPALPWLEIHSENYLLATRTPRFQALLEARRDYDLSCHGVGLSIGSAAGLDRQHLAALRGLYDRLEPILISEHLAWSSIDGHYFNDLLPLPYSNEALEAVCRNIDQAQEVLGRRLLIENPSRYLTLPDSDWPESAFLKEVTSRTGCGLLFDVNNLFVSAHNLQLDMAGYLWDLPIDTIGEIHVAGHRSRKLPRPDGTDETVLIDDHGGFVSPSVWGLLEGLLAMTGSLPVLVEWDNDIPPLSVLLAEAARAQGLIDAGSSRGQAIDAA